MDFDENSIMPNDMMNLTLNTFNMSKVDNFSSTENNNHVHNYTNYKKNFGKFRNYVQKKPSMLQQ